MTTKDQSQHDMKVGYIGVYSQQSVGLGEELLLQRDDDDLRVLPGLLSEETGHLDTNARSTQV